MFNKNTVLYEIKLDLFIPHEVAHYTLRLQEIVGNN
jgi:hypothetical protein